MPFIFLFGILIGMWLSPHSCGTTTLGAETITDDDRALAELKAFIALGSMLPECERVCQKRLLREP